MEWDVLLVLSSAFVSRSRLTWGTYIFHSIFVPVLLWRLEYRWCKIIHHPLFLFYFKGLVLLRLRDLVSFTQRWFFIVCLWILGHFFLQIRAVLLNPLHIYPVYCSHGPLWMVSAVNRFWNQSNDCLKQYLVWNRKVP